jgi:hypothetical protein
VFGEIKSQSIRLQDKREEATVTFYSAVRALCTRFEQNVGKTKDPFFDALVEVQKKALVIQGLISEAESVLGNDDFKNAASVQGCVDRLNEYIEKFTLRPIPAIPRTPGNRLVPRYKTISLKIPNFPRVVEELRGVEDEDARCICSERKGIYGGMWRVRVYPCGKSEEAGNYASVFIELWKGRAAPTPYYYRLVVLHSTDYSRCLTKEHRSLFEELDSWGWNKGISLKTVLSGGPDGQFLWPEDDSLRIEVGIRPESYRILAQDCAEKCESMDLKCAALKGEIDEIEFRKRIL